MKSLNRNNIVTIFSAIVFFVAILTSCVPDFYGVDYYEDGETDVTATVVFSPVTDALSDTRTAGDAIKRIESLCVLIYDNDGNFVRSEQVGQENIDQTGNSSTSDDAVGDGEDQSETKTPQARFVIKNLQNGKYKIYAVANMGDITQNYDVSTIEKLKDVSLKWNADDIAANNQMLGYFTSIDTMTSIGFDAPTLTIQPGRNQIHSWLKRAVSKVTVAIDGSKLNDGVQVWIKSIQVKDIPAVCWLGKDNVPANKDLISDGEKIVVNESMSADGPYVSNSNPIFYPNMEENPKDFSKAHTETQEALYFFENMQGIGQSKKQVWPDQEDKTKPMFPSGNDPLDKGFKDNKKDGTYVEVIGYYKGRKNGEDSEGPIVYRFMLGKNVDDDYNAQRNYHYKLTLRLLGNANDSDWHIVYDSEPDIDVPNPYFISYLYDRSMNLPIKLMGKEIKSLHLEIEENGWHAINAGNELPPVYWDGNPNNPGPWNGFLSLRKTTVARFGTVEEGYKPGYAITYTYNKEYWDDKKRGTRDYTDFTPGKKTDADGDYTVSTNGAGEWNVLVPLYTRAAVMVEQTGYTGNNPYVGYRREAKVKITAKIVGYDGIEHTVENVLNEKNNKREPITIYQMRRIVNPKGIWRPANSVKPFHVEMMVQIGENSDTFEPLISEGPWVAVIQKGDDWFDIEPTAGRSQKNADGTISGIGDMYEENNDGRIVDFTFRPKGTTTSPRGGIIKIYYNNYTCIHLIFVRQGYDPVSFYDSKVKWHSFNLRTATEEVEDPLLEGSYFRRYNTEFPIAASNNSNDMFGLVGNKIVWKDNSKHDFVIAGTNSTKKWSEITTENKEWKEFEINGKKCRLAKPADIQSLLKNTNTVYGYGVLYTDGTEETIQNVADVYGAREGDYANKGMRGVFVCDTVSGTQIFFPISATGYGRFKQKAMTGRENRQQEGFEGVNQYANRWEPMPEKLSDSNPYGAAYKPLLWDIYRREGAIYWVCNDDNVKLSNNGLDINYYSFNFFDGTTDNLGIADWANWGGGDDPSGSDALMMRLVEDVEEADE